MKLFRLSKDFCDHDKLFVDMYILLLFYALCNFFYGKMFILFPQEASLLFNINLATLAETMFLFKGGNLIGTLGSFIQCDRKKSLIASLVILLVMNVFFICYSKTQEYFALSRMISGLILGFIPGIYTQFINNEASGATHNKYISMIFNSNIIVLPIAFFFMFILPIQYWFVTISFFLIVHVLYLVRCKTGPITNVNATLAKNINWKVIKNHYKYGVLYGSFVVILMFFAICALMSNPYMLNGATSDGLYKFLLRRFTDHKKIIQIYQQIPSIVAMIAFLLQNRINKIFLLLITLFSLLLNFCIDSNTLLMINNGLIYSLYVVIGPIMVGYVKNITSLLYMYKILCIMILHKLFLGKTLKILLEHKNYYFLIFIPFISWCLLFLIWNSKNDKQKKVAIN